jgi:hypothetical protein
LSRVHDWRRRRGQQERRKKKGDRVGPGQTELVRDSEGRPGIERKLAERKRKEGKLVYIVGGKNKKEGNEEGEGKRYDGIWGSNRSET